MAIHSIKIGNNTEEINLKNKLKVGAKTYDGSAEITITASDLGLAAAMKFLGTSATAITDGAKTNPITIGSTSTTVTSGNVVLYGSKEFVWTGSAWEELGNEGSYKVVQTAVSDPSASGNATAFIDSISQDTNGKITVTKKNVNFPATLPANGGNADTVDNKHAADFATAAQGTKADNAVPNTRKINNKALSSDITLNASDVGALPSTTTIPSKTSQLTNDSGFISTLPYIPAAANDGVLTIKKNGSPVQTFSANQANSVEADITVPTKISELTNDEGFITSASLPTVNNATLTIQKNGSNVATFTANSASNATANITVPTKTSDLTNDSGFSQIVAQTTDPGAGSALAAGVLLCVYED